MSNFYRSEKRLMISIAAYLKEGKFMHNIKGAYCLNPDAGAWFAEFWREISGANVPVSVFHDGMAAARLLPEAPAAMIVFGTSIGYGFRV